MNINMLPKLSERRHRFRFKHQAEINITPLVDVMLVLLIVFMISAPLLNVGVPIDLPKTDANALPSKSKPINITINKEGQVYLQESEVDFKILVNSLIQLSGNNFQERLYIRADANVDYGYVVSVMAHINKAGFSNLALVTDSFIANNDKEIISDSEEK